MKRRIVLAVLLLALLLATTGSIASANLGHPLAYGVLPVVAYTDGVYLARASFCAHPCNYQNEVGYWISQGHGATYSLCTANATRRDNMTAQNRWEYWAPGDEPTVGETACVFWCCQPVPAVMIFHWEFRTVTDGWWPD